MQSADYTLAELPSSKQPDHRQISTWTDAQVNNTKKTVSDDDTTTAKTSSAAATATATSVAIAASMSPATAGTAAAVAATAQKQEFSLNGGVNTLQEVSQSGGGRDTKYVHSKRTHLPAFFVRYDRV